MKSNSKLPRRGLLNPNLFKTLIFLWCLLLSGTLSAQSVDTLDFFNRFADYYSINQLKIPVDSAYLRANKGFTGCECSDLGTEFETGYFNIWFEDCEYTSTGFNDPILGKDRRKVLCKVFGEVADMIQLQSGGCGGYQVVNVRVRPSQAVPQAGVNSPLPDDKGGQASAFYYRYKAGVIDGIPWEVINTGGIPQEWGELYHGEVRINFEASADFDWSLDIANGPASGSGLSDLYTVVWHEAMHMLGFTSLLTTLPSKYSRYDKYLFLEYPDNSTIDAIEHDMGFDWTLHTMIINNPDDLYKGCQDGSNPSVLGPDMFFQTGTANLPVLAAADDEDDVLEEQSHSHLNIDCDGTSTDEFLMHWNLPPETRRTITDREKDVLCQIGYMIDTPGYSCGCTVAGAEDFGPACGLTYEVSLCETLLIKESDLIANDNSNVSGIAFLDVINPLLGTVADNGDGSYTFTPSRVGQVVLGYIPTGCNGETGNVTNVYVKVYPGNNCPEAYECSELATCETFTESYGYCFAYSSCDNLSTCNLICNPVMCGTVYGNADKFNGLLDFSFPPSNTINNAVVPNWIRTHGTPDFNSELSFTQTPTGTILVNSAGPTFDRVGNSEGFMTLIEGLSAQDYLFSFDYIGSTSFGTTVKLEVDLIEVEEMNYVPEVNSFADYTGQSFNLVDMTNSMGYTGQIRYGDCFSLNSNIFDGLWFYAPRLEGIGSFSIDNVELVPDNFSAGPDLASPFCGALVPLGEQMCMLSDVGVQYEWFEVDGSNNETSLVSFTVLNDELSNIVNPNQVPFDEANWVIRVAPEVTTTYRLRRTIIADGGISELSFCTTEDDVVISVDGPGLPLPMFTYDVDCQMVSFVSEFEGGTYTWNFGDGTSSNDENPMHTYILPGPYTVQLTLSTECGFANYSEQIIVEDCGTSLGCAECNEQNTYGVDGEEKLLSTLLAPVSTTGQTLCFKGRILVKEQYLIQACDIVMNPGAAFVIEDEGALTLLDNQIVGCDNMWRGVEVESGGTIKMFNNLVADAQYAIFVPNAPPSGNIPLTRVTAAKNTFRNNFVSILVPENNNVPVTPSVYSNRFLNDMDLKTPYSGQTATPENLPQQDDRTLAGIIFNDIKYFSSFSNRFINLTSGITLNNVDGILQDSEFSGILGQAGVYNGYTAKGNGIYSIADGARSLQVLDSDFFNTDLGIRTIRVSFTGTGNHFKDVYEGMRISHANIGGVTIGGSFFLDGNHFENVDYAIAVFNPDVNADVRIINNEIEANVGGIYLTYSTADAVVQDNEIYGDVDNAGITMKYTQNATVEGNDITLETTNAYAGIDVRLVTDCAFRDNVITGAGITGTHNYGMRLYSSSGNVYCCNDFDNTRLGVYFVGDNQATDRFRGNDFITHETGLYLNGFAAILGTQTHTENTWTSTSGGAEYFGVTDFDVQPYQFRVDPAQNTLFMPPTHSPDAWFLPEANPSSTSACSETICVIGGFNPNHPDNKRIAQDSIDAGIYTNTIQWELERYLYKNVAGQWVQDPDIANFILTSYSNNIGGFYELDQDLNTALTANAAELNQLESNLSTIQTKLKLINDLEEALLTASGSQAQTLENSRLQLAGEIDPLVSANDSLLLIVLNDRAAEALTLYAQNNSISATATYSQNQKTVNGIFLQYMNKGMQGLTAGELSSLQTIAQQCPLSAGHAVLQARALIAVVNEEVVNYNDDLICSGGQLIQAPQEGTVSDTDISRELIVFPNPAKDEITILLPSGLEEESLRLTIYDTFGKAILKRVVREPSFNISIRDLANGMYFLKVQSTEKEYVTKVMISH